MPMKTAARRSAQELIQKYGIVEAQQIAKHDAAIIEALPQDNPLSKCRDLYVDIRAIVDTTAAEKFQECPIHGE